MKKKFGAHKFGWCLVPKLVWDGSCTFTILPSFNAATYTHMQSQGMGKVAPLGGLEQYNPVTEQLQAENFWVVFILRTEQAEIFWARPKKFAN